VDYIKIFVDHLLYDKEFALEFCQRHPMGASTLGEYINKEWHEKLYLHALIPGVDELIDFIDGNGFIVDRNEEPNFISILIVYEEKEDEEKKSLNGMVFSIQQTVLSYTSMEDNQRYILEYEKLLASWAFWFRVCRRVELLQLVSKGCRGSSPVPRPP